MARVALWGAFDPARLEDALVPAIVRAELERRVPGLTLTVGTSLGATPARGLLVERVAPLDDVAADDMDLVVIVGDGAAGAARAPFVLLAADAPSTSALAAASRVTVTDALAFAGVLERGVSRDVAVVPDVRFLAGRLATPAELEGRVRALRASGLYPEGDALLVDVDVPDADLAVAVGFLCSHYEGTPVLLGPSARLADRLPGAFVVPEDRDPLDVLAMVGWSAGTVSTSLGTNLVAAAFDRPALLLGADEVDAARLGLPERVVPSTAGLVEAFHAVRQRGSITDVLARHAAAIDLCLDDIVTLVLDPSARAVAATPVEPEAGIRALHARIAALEAEAAEREAALLAWLRSQSVAIAEEDVRFTRLWNKIHEADRHYHFHVQRADRAEAQVAALRAQVVQLSNPLAALKRLTPTRVARGVKRRVTEKPEPRPPEPASPDDPD